jgi:hypothetical protein
MMGAAARAAVVGASPLDAEWASLRFVPNFRIKLPRCIFTVTSLIERSFATCC